MIKSFRFKKFASIFTALMLVLSLITPMNALADEVNSDEVTIQILATSDLHGRFYPYEYATNAENTKGSLTQIATAIKELKEENSNTIIVDNGDTIQDNSSDLFLDDENHPMIVAMNEIGYDTWTLGNHEFNYLPKLDKIMEQSKAKVLCGNVYKTDGTRLAAPYTIVEKGGVKVGIIGMVTPNITKWDAKNLEGYKVTNPVEETKAAVEELKGKADIIIAVEHMGLESEYNKPGSGAKELAEACPELTAIIAGHAHSKVEGEVVNGVLITEPYKYANALSQVEVKLTKKDDKYIVAGENAVTSKLVYVSEKESDAELMDTLKPYHETALKDANSIVGELKGGNLVEATEIEGIPTAQISDNAMLDLINEVELYYGKANVSSSACFRSDANMLEGPIKKSDVALIYKYDNTLKTLKINGKQLKEYMEWSVKYYNQYVDGDLTVSFDPNVRIYNYDVFSGVKYDIDISKPAGNRITNLTWMDGTTVEDTDEVKLAVNNYRADTSLMNSENGLFKDSDAEVIFDSFEEMGDAGRLRDLIRDYIVNVKGGVITPNVDNNWKITGTNFNKEDRAEIVKLINDGTLEIPTSQDGRSPNAASVNNYDLLKVKGMKQIDVICFNDFHGSVKESGKNQGIAKVAGEINKKKAQNPNTIVVSAGDNFQGSAMSNLTYGAPVNEFMKAVGVTASAVGNHEFDWGVDKISKWAEEGEYDFLASNIYDKTTGKPVEWAKPYKIVEMDGVKVGFIGVATPETAFKTKPENVANLEFRDPVVAATEWTKTVRENGADVVIALTHVGSFQDRETKDITGNAIGLCDIEGLDAIISAHTHQSVCGVINGTPIIQPYKQGRALGYLSIVIDENDKVKEIKPSVDFLYSRSETVVEDKEVKSIYEKYIKDVEPILNEVVGYTENELSHDRWNGPSALGEWVCDVMRKVAGTQIGLTNGGGLRCPIPQGDVTMGTLYEVMPFDNTLYKMEIKGSDLKKNVEHGINNDVVGWLEVGGLYVKYNNDGKVTEMTLEDGTPIEMDRYYTAVTNDFMFTGGDNYDFSGAINHADMNIPIRDALVKELKEVKKLNFEFKGYLPKTATETTTNVYVVKLGDTLGAIATKYNVSVKEIAEASEISNPALIFPGDKVIIPGATVEENDNTYTVKAGDTLGAIGQQYGVDYKDLAEYNNIENANLIFANQKILIPVK